MNKKIVKLAVIRDDENKVCPFGLDITHACKIIGNTVDNMTPVIQVSKEGFDSLVTKDKQILEEIINNNWQVFAWAKEEAAPCKYANMIFEDKQKVECSFGDEAAGIGNANFIGFPSYTQYFSAGYSAVPIGFYSEHPVRNQIGNLEAMVSSTFADDKSDEDKIKK